MSKPVKCIKFSLPNGGQAIISKPEPGQFLIRCYTYKHGLIAQYRAYSITEAVRLAQYLKGSMGKRVLQRVA